MASQGLGTIRETGNSHARRGGWAWRGALVALLGLVLLAPGALGDVKLEWATAIGGTSNDWGHGIAVDDAGNVYITGSFSGTADFNPGPDVYNLSSAGETDIFVQKLDAEGNFVWARSMGGADWDHSFDIAVDGAGNVYTTGHFRDTVDFDPGPGDFNLTSSGYENIFVQKLDAEGNFLWARAMVATKSSSGNGIALDDAGNVYTTGYFHGTADFDPGPGTFNLNSKGFISIFVLQLDSDGHFVWARSIGGTGTNVGNGIAVDGTGNVYTTGYFWNTVDFDPGPGVFELTSEGFPDIFVQKLDSDGRFVWARSIGGTGSDVGEGIAVDGAGNVYTTGSFTGTVDFDPGPGVFELTSEGFADIFVQKLDNNGDFVWAKAIGGPLPDEGRGIAVDGADNVYTTGYFNGNADFDPGPGAFNLTSAGFHDIFVQKMDADGDFVWTRSMGGMGNDEGRGIAVDETGKVYTTGYFRNTADFDPGPGTFNLTSAGGGDIFVVKFRPDITPPNAISIAPTTAGPTNASSVNITVTFDEAVLNFEDASDLVIDHTGTASTGASITGGPEVYTVTVEGISGDGSFTLAVNTASDVVDLARNPLASSVTSAPVVIDHTAPSLTALTVSPSALARGEVALIQFTVSEMLLGDPLVQVAGTPAAVAPLEAVKSLGHSYSWTAPADAPVGRITGRTLVPGVGYFNPDPWPYGPQALEITLTDLAGNTLTHTEPEGLALVSGLPVAWPGLAVLAMLSAAAFAFRTRRKIRSE